MFFSGGGEQGFRARDFTRVNQDLDVLVLVQNNVTTRISKCFLESLPDMELENFFL